MKLDRVTDLMARWRNGEQTIELADELAEGLFDIIGSNRAAAHDEGDLTMLNIPDAAERLLRYAAHGCTGYLEFGRSSVFIAHDGDTCPVHEPGEPNPLTPVVMAAVAVLDSEAGVKSLAELAAAVKAADFGDFTNQYPDPEGFTGECPSCHSLRPAISETGILAIGSVCPNCGHVEPPDDES